MTELVFGGPKRPQLTTSGTAVDEMDSRGERESIRRVGLGLLESPYPWDVASESTDKRTRFVCEWIQPGVGCDVCSLGE